MALLILEEEDLDIDIEEEEDILEDIDILEDMLADIDMDIEALADILMAADILDLKAAILEALRSMWVDMAPLAEMDIWAREPEAVI